ncbi:NAD-dependent epimerase/dehydratase family protein [Candidatus Pseudomonas adelgestsugas]|uniref:3 beta-hydroxysteroid dehydrogenase/Delta 5-->4-isomerase n=1 Tax=Candidatus Pseudomonas adelgestsugas TaxID=1302376 RepID=A0ABX5R9M2_9PSED|nr:NAD-dependent epimerase/dehydratase family protein [Candidatus Pseudomonas adelgestsugas]QAX82011.1 3 beta-hydroxysteroid dehydrogenase/Delta 5-->4-isomerase [Candidatus Pseudomonas adelgestsugas]
MLNDVNNHVVVKKPTILLTGGTGFVGCSVLRTLINLEYPVVNITRKNIIPTLHGVQNFLIGSLINEIDWKSFLSGVNVVIHAAGCAHVMYDIHRNQLQTFRKVNVDVTLKLARQAATAGIKRFIFISSIKVNGEETSARSAFTSFDIPMPLDDYGRSKHEAEQALLELAGRISMEVVIIRPVLVYGPGVKANFECMLSVVNKKLPLPFRAINNRRSLVFIDNLVDLICVCINHPAAKNRVFLVSDDDDLSIGQILEKLAVALHTSPYLFTVPKFLLNTAALLTGQKKILQRLCGSLQVDMTDTRERLSWTPPVSVDEAFAVTARYFQEQQAGKVNSCINSLVKMPI